MNKGTKQMKQNLEWIYVYEEPVHHKGIFEIGMTTRTVEQRNKEKRSLHQWKLKAKYAVADASKAEKEIINATSDYRFNGRKEILEINWRELQNIIDPIVKFYSHKEYNDRIKQNFINNVIQTAYKDQIAEQKQNNWDPQWNEHSNKWEKKINTLKLQANELYDENGRGKALALIGGLLLLGTISVSITLFGDMTFDSLGVLYFWLVLVFLLPGSILFAGLTKMDKKEKADKITQEVRSIKNSLDQSRIKFYNDAQADFDEYWETEKVKMYNRLNKMNINLQAA